MIEQATLASSRRHTSSALPPETARRFAVHESLIRLVAQHARGARCVIGNRWNGAGRLDYGHLRRNISARCQRQRSAPGERRRRERSDARRRPRRHSGGSIARAGDSVQLRARFVDIRDGSIQATLEPISAPIRNPEREIVPLRERAISLVDATGFAGTIATIVSPPNAASHAEFDRVEGALAGGVQAASSRES
jgi:hypothetical protein